MNNEATTYSKAKPDAWMQEEVDHACSVAPAAAKRMRILLARWQDGKATGTDIQSLHSLCDKYNS